jgi:flagellar protein FlgJ
MMLIPAIPAISQAKAIAQKGKELRKATQGLEAHFVHQLLTAMRRTVPNQPGGANAIYSDMMDESVAKQVAENGGIGIGNLLYDKLAPVFLRGMKAKDGQK